MVKLHGYNASLLGVLRNLEFIVKHFENLEVFFKHFKNLESHVKYFEKFGIPL